MTRFVAVFVAVGVSIVGAGAARAQETGMLPGGARITWERFFIKKGSDFVEPSDLEERRRYLNLAHCTCAKEGQGDETEVQYEVKLSAETGATAEGQLWVGTMCQDDELRPMMCRQLGTTISDIDTLFTPDPITLNLFDVINGKEDAMACKQREGDALAFLLVNSNNMYVYTTSISVGEVMPDVPGIDTQPPPLPDDLAASGSEESIEITWTPPESRSEDYYAFQALCALAEDDSAVHPDVFTPQYQTAASLCGAASEVTLQERPLSLGNEDPVDAVPFGGLEGRFLCGEQSSGTARSLRIEGLENDRRYKVALLAIDRYGNASGAYFTSTVTPEPVTDFWEDLHDRDSAIDGGCLLSTTYGDGNPLTRTLRAFRDDTLARTALGRWLTDAYYATLGKLTVASLPARIAVGIALLPLVAVALLWHLLGLPLVLLLLALPWLWRRRHRAALPRRLATAAAAAALLLAPGLAAADDFMPYWEEPAQEDGGLDAPGDVKWHVGIRVGPYTPDIDLQFPLNPTTGVGPYEAMFGTYYLREGDELKRHERRVYQILPMLDVDRIVWRGFGQLGVGGSLGYMQKTAYAYANGTNQSDVMRERATSAENTFRLIPLAATLTYRLTYLDDRWGIPVIPYVRGGLSYYVWWMKGPTGDLSKVCDATDPDDPMTCTDEDKAYGGTPGVQLSAGIAIRAERIDRDAARSMRNSGIKHAGFYGEVFWGRVDGFGSETRLWVGDTTWFAGANFEF